MKTRIQDVCKLIWDLRDHRHVVIYDTLSTLTEFSECLSEHIGCLNFDSRVRILGSLRSDTAIQHDLQAFDEGHVEVLCISRNKLAGYRINCQGYPVTVSAICDMQTNEVLQAMARFGLSVDLRNKLPGVWDGVQSAARIQDDR
ncbi:hypothetical protein [Burkholderia phage BCSR5]|nr:hypothetical protein [Burkholderia phage BCSR5]